MAARESATFDHAFDMEPLGTSLAELLTGGSQRDQALINASVECVRTGALLDDAGHTTSKWLNFSLFIAPVARQSPVGF